MPTSWYKYGNEEVKPYKIRIQPPLPNDSQKTRRYYESKLADYPDVIDVAAVVDFTGYNHHTVCEWIRFRKAPCPSVAAQVHDPEVLSDRLALLGGAQHNHPQVSPPH